MGPFSDAWNEEQRRRWIRPDAHLWIATDPERFGPLDPEVKRILDEQYEFKHGRSPAQRSASERAAGTERDAQRRALIERIRVENEVLRDEIQAMKAALLGAKANFNPAQPRDEIGRWTDTGAGQRNERVRLASSDKPALTRHVLYVVLGEIAGKLIRAYRSENGLRDLFGIDRGVVTVTTMDGVDIFGSNSSSPTYTREDVAAATQLRDRLVEKYPDVFKTEGIARLPNNAVTHAETTVLLRAAHQNGGTLAGRTLDVFGDARMCNNCETILPYVGLELGNPTVTFSGPHGRYTMKDGVWISMGKRR